MAKEVKALKSRFKDRADILDLTSFYSSDDVFKADYLIEEESGKKLEKEKEKSKAEKEEKSEEASESSRVEGEDGEKTENHRIIFDFPVIPLSKYSEMAKQQKFGGR